MFRIECANCDKIYPNYGVLHIDVGVILFEYLKFRSVFRTRPAAPLTFLLTALFCVPVLPSSHVFDDGSIFRTRPAVPLTFLLMALFFVPVLPSSHVFARFFLIPGSVRAASPFC